MNRSKDSSFNRRTRTESALKLVNSLKCDEISREKIFQQVELTALEAALKEDLVRNQSLQNIINLLVNDADPLSSKKLRMFNSEVNGTEYSESEWREVREEVQQLDRDHKRLKRQMVYMQERYSNLVRAKNDQRESHIISAEVRLKNSLNELLKLTGGETEISDPYEMVYKLMERSNEFFKDVSSFNVEEMIDDMALASCIHNSDDLIENFLHKLIVLLKRIKENLDHFRQSFDCLRTYLNEYIKKDILWRREMNLLLCELDECKSNIKSKPKTSPHVQGDICWYTVEKLMDLSGKYVAYSEKLKLSMENVKKMIDIALKA